jgi:hypothetical protein
MGHGREVLKFDSFFCVLVGVDMSSLLLCNGYCSLPSVLRYCDSETLRNQFIFPQTKHIASDCYPPRRNDEVYNEGIIKLTRFGQPYYEGIAISLLTTPGNIELVPLRVAHLSPYIA